MSVFQIQYFWEHNYKYVVSHYQGYLLQGTSNLYQRTQNVLIMRKPDLSREPTRMTFFDPSVYIHSARLGADEQVSLYWNYDYETEILDFAVDVEAVGWAGFGISQMEE
eukprot:TRINITY_DN417_c0_g2_i2.p2 TRINITY_DN417_c0_g2~~TRINITY_DN417_c0_g2_i2.p2  ORF type:complete len:109 (+),score=27.41 TRINITY_DN417_c0_g2_i2:120-446(+)